MVTRTDPFSLMAVATSGGAGSSESSIASNGAPPLSSILSVPGVLTAMSGAAGFDEEGSREAADEDASSPFVGVDALLVVFLFFFCCSSVAFAACLRTVSATALGVAGLRSLGFGQFVGVAGFEVGFEAGFEALVGVAGFEALVGVAGFEALVGVAGFEEGFEAGCAAAAIVGALALVCPFSTTFSPPPTLNVLGSTPTSPLVLTNTGVIFFLPFFIPTFCCISVSAGVLLATARFLATPSFVGLAN